MREDGQPPAPKSVIDEVARLTGHEPSKILLRDSDSALSETPIIDPKSPEKKLVPEGRGNYQILGEIARGGMGVILKSHDHDLGRDVALKVLDPELAKNPAVVQRFVEEAQVAGQLQHPGIVPVYEMGLMADERPYFTMKLIKGRTLAAILSARKTLEDDRRRHLAIFEQICQTVAYAHSKGVIHRDLKPANVMVGSFGEVQVVDWGLAKVLKAGGVEDEVRAKHSNLTVIETVRSGPGSSGSQSMVGSVMGTPAYMPPEQAMGEVAKVDERSDVFSLGAILCEILTGRPPYTGRDGGKHEEKTVVQAAQALLDPARERIEECSADDELKRLCLSCLTPARQARPGNAEELAAAIHDYLATLEQRTHQAQVAAAEAAAKAEGERHKRKLTVALAGSILVAIAGVGGLLYVQAERQKEQLAEAEREVDDAQGEILSLQSAGRFEDALAVALATISSVEDSGAGATLDGRARRLEEQARQQIQEEGRRLEKVAHNQRLLDRLDELRFDQIERLTNDNSTEAERDLDASYTEVFREYGVDVDEGDLTEVLDDLRASGIGAEVALGLDDWAAVRRERFGTDSYEAEMLTALALDLDRDSLRTELREAIYRAEAEPLLELLEQHDVSSLPPETAWMLADALAQHGENKVAARLAIDSVQVHRDDFRLNILAGAVRSRAVDDMSALQYLSVARSLRPSNARVHQRLAYAHFRTHDFIAAADSFEEAHRIDPELPGLGYWGWAHLLLGEYDRAVELFEESVQRNPGHSVIQANLLVGRVFAQEAPLEDLLTFLEEHPNPNDNLLRNVSFTLLHHPDPSVRDSERAVELMTAAVAMDDNSRENVGVYASALLLAGRPAEALEQLEREALMFPLGSPAIMAVQRYRKAIALFMLEDREKAEDYLEDGEWYRARAEHADPERFSGSYVARWQREALALQDG